MNITEISNLDMPELAVYDCRSEIQLRRYYEPEPGIFIAESPKVIVRALDAGYRPVSVLLEKRLLEKALAADGRQGESGGDGLLEEDGGGGRQEEDVGGGRQEEDVGEGRQEEGGADGWQEVGGNGWQEKGGGDGRAAGMSVSPETLLVREILGRCGGIPVYTAGPEVLTRITGFQLTQGALCAMRRRKMPEAEEILREDRDLRSGAPAERGGSGRLRLAVLEDITNQTNIGAIFRSAAALGFDAVLLTPDCCDPLYRRSIRVSMGAVFQIPWTFLPGGEYVSWLKGHGFAAAAMALCDDSVGIDDPRLAAEEKMAVILGNEGQGLRPATIGACDYTVKIPMAHGVDSLNVAAAGAVAFWQLGRRPQSFV